MKTVPQKAKQSEEILYNNPAGTISFDPKNGFLFMDWKGFITRRDAINGLEKVVDYLHSHYQGPTLPPYRQVKANLLQLIISMSHKWQSSEGAQAYSLICYPSDLTSPSGLNYLKEKYRLA